MLAAILALSLLISDADMVATTSTEWNPAAVASYISQQASLRGIDPTTALAVARTEGLNNPVGDAGKSFGPYQLYTGGGLGNSFLNATGLNPSDYLNNWQAQVQWFLNWAVQNGWNPGGVGLGSSYVGGTGGGSHGASAAGIGNWQGLGGAFTVPLDFTQVPSTTIPSQQPTTTDTGTGSTVTSGITGTTGVNTTTNASGVPPPTGLNLSFAGSLQHIIFQFLLVLVGLALLLGGIYLLGSRK